MKKTLASNSTLVNSLIGLLALVTALIVYLNFSETDATKLKTSPKLISNTFVNRVSETPAFKTSPGNLNVPITMWGDSMTDALSSLGSFPGTSTTFIGEGGETTSQLAALEGGVPWTGDIPTNRIPSSGILQLINVSPDALGSSNFSNKSFTYSWPVSISSIDGILTRSINGANGMPQYTFARISKGRVTSVKNPVEIISNLAPKDLSQVDIYPVENLDSQDTIIWLGRNGVGGGSRDTNPSVIERMLSKLNGGPNQKVLILPPFNGGTEVRTSSYIDPLQIAFPMYYFDVRKQFIEYAKNWFSTNYPTEFASTWKSSCPQNTCLGSLAIERKTNSDWDVSHSIPPRALRLDAVHLNEYGNELLKSLISMEINRRGWLS